MDVVMGEDEEPRRLPRADLNEEQVHAACDSLNLKGVEPTYKLVRAELGDHGSYSTIAKYVKTWGPAARPQAPNMPVDLVKDTNLFAKAVWAVAFNSANALFDKERDGYRQQVEELLQAVKDTESDNTRYQRALASSQSIVTALEVKCADCEQRVAEAEADVVRLQGEVAGLVKALKEVAVRGEPDDQPGDIAAADSLSRILADAIDS
jgi:Plasmid replication region DNA-binding N-term